MNFRHSISSLLPGIKIARVLLVTLGALLLFQANVTGQTFEFPAVRYVDSLSLRSIVATPGADTLTIKQGDYNSMSGPATGSNFTIKSLHALTQFKVNVQSPDVGQKNRFTYVITYKTIGTADPANPNNITVSPNTDTLSVTYDRDSLGLTSDRALSVAGKYHKLMIIIYDVFEVTNSGSGPTYTPLTPAMAAANPNLVPTFVNVLGEVHVQKFINYPSLSMNNNVYAVNNTSINGTVLLNWGASLAYVKPAGYEVEWTYLDPATTSAPSPSYDFRNNATRVFTNSTSFSIPVAQKEGSLVYRVRMVRPSLSNLLDRAYGSWTSPASVTIQRSGNDSVNWDLKTSFVEEGKYKGVFTYYDGLLKPRQAQTRFNSKPGQTIVAQTLFDYEGRPVISSLPIPVKGAPRFSYLSNFLHPADAQEYDKLMYDALPDTTHCPARELPIPPLAPEAAGNKYYSRYNSDKTGSNAFIPDAEGYPMVRKIIAAENSDKVLFEGKAGYGLQLGNDHQTAYLYGSPLQAELNRYFGQDIGKYNYYRKMITTDAHRQDMFSITDDEGKPVATGLIGTPDTNSLALSIFNEPVNSSFHANLMPVPDIRLGEDWRKSGSYFVEMDANDSFQYHIDYNPFKPCTNSSRGLMPKVYFNYEIVDNCGKIRVSDSGALGGTGTTSLTALSYSKDTNAFLAKGNHVWNKHSYIKMEDLAGSVDQYLDSADQYLDFGENNCYLTYSDFLKQEFKKARFPCKNDDDPCKAKELAMMKEMYPGAKYGQYQYANSVSKTFGGPANNSIFSIYTENTYRYQQSCIAYPDTVVVAGRKYWNIRQLPPQQLIDIFCDTIARALLPLHPDYCKLLLCGLTSNTYGKVLSTIRTVANAVAASRYALTDIVNNDPLFTNAFLTANELLRMPDGEERLDTAAFRKTICGSGYGVIESVCREINKGKGPADIVNYPQYIQDEYYQNLTGLYNANRDERIGRKMQQAQANCGPCSYLRLVNPNLDTFPGAGVNDTTFMISGLDSVSRHTSLPVGSSFGSFFDPNSASGITRDTIAGYANYNNSTYCTELVDGIIGSLSNCTSSQTLLNVLRDTLTRRFCTNNATLASLTYDSLNSIITRAGMNVNDLCNAGLADLRKITQSAGDQVQPGLLHFPPAYYNDLSAFLNNNALLAFIAGSSQSMNLTLSLCDAHPFEQNLARQLGVAGTPANCSNTISVLASRSSNTDANAVKLAFSYGAAQVAYYLYPAASGEYNGLNADFNSAVISNAQNLRLKSLFNLYGFDKLAQSFANRNTTQLTFQGIRNGNQQDFVYLLSAFNEQSDYNLMEKDRQEYLNGVGCSEYLKMVQRVLSAASALNIQSGHPFFEPFFTNMVNSQNGVNFDFDNYATALESCGITDSIIIPKVLAHFRLRFPSSVSLAAMASYMDNLINVRGIGVTDMYGYQQDNYKYLMLNIFEANGKNISQSRTIIMGALPSGSTLEYLPSQQKDTVARLLVPDFAPINASALSAAFPNAGISSTATSLYYIIPGYNAFEIPGKSISIVQNIGANYSYNHMLDSVCRFVRSSSPMATVFSHALSAVSARYGDWQMTAWRNYVTALDPANHNELVKQSKPNRFNTINAGSGANTFASSAFSYFNARMPYYSNNLYIDHDPNGYGNYGYLRQLLYNLQQYNNSSLLTPTAPGSYIPGLNNYGTETRAYVCGDTTQFWINHFSAHNEMTNIFIKLPAYLPMPRTAYRILSISKGFEADSVTYLYLKMAGQQGSFKDTIACIAYTNRNLGATYTIPSAFLASHSRYGQRPANFENCETRTIEALYPIARIKYGYYRDSVRTDLIARFRQDVISNLHEQLYIFGSDIKHGITLYYYDMAGNLIKTVSPGGVAQLDVSGANNDTIDAHRLRNEQASPLLPAHHKVTTYRYNAQNKVTESLSPDGGRTLSYYDLAGRVTASQSARQQPYRQYTYFLYDNLSRVIETGVVVSPYGWPEQTFTSPGSTMANWVRGTDRREVTATVYDVPAYGTASPFNRLPAQENLKNRVSAARYFDLLPRNANGASDTNIANALYYSYDISGNVKTLIHDLRTTADPVMRLKRVDYEYDLYSGKMLLVSYNRGYADQFYQKYAYDADNRLTDVQTSGNGLVWDRDAHYHYYDHGPLARTELGEQRVQGVDYAYTINGWLKATNGIANDGQSDMGKDGTAGRVMPPDVFSQRIDYFNGDYKAIDDSNYFRQLPQAPKALYNGNIAGIATALAPFDNIYSNYHYDPLQRIARADYAGYTPDPGDPAMVRTAMDAYASAYRYDADGNLLRLRRQGGNLGSASQPMDRLSYHYTPGTNRLTNLQDSATTTAYGIDIPPMVSDTNLLRFDYDQSGNMTKDGVSGLTAIDWNHGGKVKSVTKADNTVINFVYDPLGNRLAKEVVQRPDASTMLKHKTVYVRDAAGNPLAVYEDNKTFGLEQLRAEVLTPVSGVLLPIGFADVLAGELLDGAAPAQAASLPKQVMALPALEEYAGSQNLLAELVSSLSSNDRLAFIKSVPAITRYAFTGPGVDGQDAPMSEQRLSFYLQPVMLSAEMKSSQGAIFSALKTHDSGLYYQIAAGISGATPAEAAAFPDDSSLLQRYGQMSLEDQMALVSQLSGQLLAGEPAGEGTMAQPGNTADSTMPAVAEVLISAYSPANTYARFVQDVPGADLILEELGYGAQRYLAYRYGLVNDGLLAADSVKAEFRANSLLAGALSAGTDMTPDQGTLAGVLAGHYDDVVSLAAGSGRTAELERALGRVLAHTGAEQQYELLRTQVLKEQEVHLAEHDLYGSARLGVQQYLPAAVRYSYKAGVPSAGLYQGLTATRPWYSLYGNDLYSAGVYGNALGTGNISAAGMGIATHLLGKRHYELTNHLGNVQATVLDRTTPVLDASAGNAVTGYHADIATAQDYYPFGMLMPGRYTSDTSHHCITMSSSVLVQRPVRLTAEPARIPGVLVIIGSPLAPLVSQLPKAAVYVDEKPYFYHYGGNGDNDEGMLESGMVDGVGTYTLNVGGEQPGIGAYMQLHMDTGSVSQRFEYGVVLEEDMIMDVRVRQYQGTGSEEYEELLPWQSYEQSGSYGLDVPVSRDAVLAGGNTLVEYRFRSLSGEAFGIGKKLKLKDLEMIKYEWVAENRLVTVCEDDDKYRFGFNGQMKDNEIAGIGNSLDFGARIYDSRLARWRSHDKLKDMAPGWSPYRFGFDNPIRYVDEQGNFEIDKATADRYPKLKSAINFLAIELQEPRNAERLDQLVAAGSFKSREDYLSTFKDGSGPRLEVQDIVKFTLTSTSIVTGGGLTNQPLQTEHSIINRGIVTPEGLAIGISGSGEAPAALTKTRSTITSTYKYGIIGINREINAQTVYIDNSVANLLNGFIDQNGKTPTRPNTAQKMFNHTLVHENGHVGAQRAGTDISDSKSPDETGTKSEFIYDGTNSQENLNNTLEPYDK